MTARVESAGPPLAALRHTEEMPYVPFTEGVTFQLLQADVEAATWVIRTLAEPGVTIPRHRHTGEVFAFTNRGSWYYLEYPNDVNIAGTFLYEPPGSIHTLHVPGSNTEITDVWFVVKGANLDLDDEGNVENVLDAGAVLAHYLEQCAELGLTPPAVLGG